MSNILVTGGAGYLGSTLVPALLAAGHRVTVLDNFLFRQTSLNHVCHDPNFEVVKGDIRVDSILAPLLKTADIVIPLAALVGAPMCSADPVGARTINHDAILMMLGKLSREQRVLMPTTNSAYGSGDANNFCTEETPLRPISLYAREKVAVEDALMQRENAISLRLATVFGMSPRMRVDLLVNDFVHRAVHDRFVVLFEADFKRNYIHVRDVARAFMHGIERFDSMRGGIYNVGLSDANVSKRELCQRIQAAGARLRLHGRTHRQGPGPAQLHRLQREARGHRLRNVGLAGRRHRRTGQGLHDAEEHGSRQRLNRTAPGMKILYVQHDMLVWASARQWSYTTHLAYVEGLRAAGHEVLVLFTSCWAMARRIVGDHRFDQVWINDVTHVLGQRPAWEAPPPLGEPDFAWLATLAPVRVGIVMETLHYDAADYAEVPELARRVPLMQRAVLPHVSHFAVVDENDVRHVENMGARAMWTPPHVPLRCFRSVGPTLDRPAVFIGSAYQRRAKYAQHPRLRELLEFRASAEHATPWPAMFDELNNPVRQAMLAEPYQQAAYGQFVDASQSVRSQLFELYLDGLSGSLASVNLPSFVKTYAGRVIESMALGLPVVSWRIPGRPQTARLFRDGEQILLFDDDDPDRLADQLERLRFEPGFASRMGAAALANAREHHTSEHRVAQILDWIRHGMLPRHWG